MDEAIINFLNERREAWLAKNINSSMSEDEQLAKEQESVEKYSREHWLPDAAKRAGQLSLVSHPSKFSHPGSKTSMIIADATERADGFLRSGQIDLEMDVVGNAAALDVDKFLNLKLNDGKTILKHLEQASGYIKEEFNIKTSSYQDLSEGFLKVKKHDKVPITHGKVKQVYFPVEGDYHLLSLLTPSGILFELTQRIKDLRFSETTKIAREDKKHQRYNEQGYDELFNLSLMGFGGTKPQNISVLNSKNGGKAYLLPSLPPTLKKNKVRLPKRDFFSDILWVKTYRPTFVAFHKLLAANINNLNIRQGRDACVLSILDQVVHQAWQVRSQQSGWSQCEAYAQLPLYQKIWLDNHYEEQRGNEQEWLEKIIVKFSQWIIYAYQKNVPDSSITLADEELLHISKLLTKHKEALL